MGIDWNKQGYLVTSAYGNRRDPFGSGKTVWHTGIDLVKSHRAPIHAFVGGTVSHSKMGVAGTGLGGFGITVVIVDKHGASHLYAHLDSASVRVGDVVRDGQEVGKQGTTGQSTGSHLHYEVRTKSTPSYGFGCDTDPGAYLTVYFAKEAKEDVKDELMKVKLEVNGKRIDDGISIEGVTYFPSRSFANAIGATIAWDGAAKTVKITTKEAK